MSGYQMYIPRKAESCAVYEEFNQLADMIWKLPRFFENEVSIERKKLDDYFPEGNPLSTSLRAIRWNFESEKLFVAFPRFLSQTGVLMAVALFETHLIHGVNRDLAPTKSVDSLNSCRELLKRHGHVLDKLRFSKQVNLALLVRHCIIHLSGYVDHLRDKNTLLAGIASNEYLQNWQIEKQAENDEPWLSIEADANGNRLVIAHIYAFSICSLLRDNLCELLDCL